jgi:hypothetical protein
MDYRRFISSSTVDCKINDHLVECGSTTWQVRNIAATKIDQRVIPFNEPQPVFITPKPKFELNFSAMAITSIGLCGFVYLYFSSSIFATLVLVAIVATFVYFAINNLKSREAAWEKEKAWIETKWKIWDQMRRNPPVLFSLMLETNAGSKPLFYSFDKSQITKANDAIKRSMEKKEMGDIKFEIETINVGGNDSINNFGSSIYNQSIQEAQQ